MRRSLSATLGAALVKPLGRRARAVLGVIAAISFVGVAVLNLALPESRGPADQGDFVRIVSDFSSGPVGFALWPDALDPSHAQRFSTTHHRFWRLDAGASWGSQPSSSKLVFLPERHLRWPWAEPIYDLTRNTMIVMTLLGVAIGTAVYAVKSIVPAATLLVLALLTSDLQISWYVNSFYQEAGAFAFVVVALCLLFAWVATQSLGLLALGLVALALLATTKVAYAPSALVIVAGVVVVVLLRTPRRRRQIATALGLSAAILLVASVHVQRARATFASEVAYNFVFSSVLPELAEHEQRGFVQAIGLPRGMARLAGTNIYDGASEPIRPDEQALIDSGLHARAVWRLATTQPAALARVLAGAVSRTGIYDLWQAGYGHRELGAPAVEPPRIDLWSRWRAELLPGWLGYALAVLLLGTILRPAMLADGSGWSTFFAVMSATFIVASVVQVSIAILGNGPVDLLKHLYLANLCCDVAIVLGVGGVAQQYATGTRSGWSVVARRLVAASRPTGRLAYVVGLAFVVRVLVVLWIPTQPVSDFWSYIKLATNLVDDHGYVWAPGLPTAYLAPGYPLLLAALFSLVGPSVAAAKALNVVLSTATVAFGGLAARALLGPAAAVGAALILCFEPRQLLLTCLAASEHLGAPTLFAFLWLLGLSWRRQRSLRLAALAGLVLGVSALARPVGLYAWLLWPVCGLLAAKRRRNVALETVLLAVVVYGVLLPWGLRNQAVLGRFTTSTTTVGINLFMGNNDDASGSWIDWRRALGAVRPETAGLPEGALDVVAVTEARRWIAANPARAAWLYVEKLRLYFSSWDHSSVAYWAIYATQQSPPAPPVDALPGPHLLKRHQAAVDRILLGSVCLVLVLAMVGAGRLLVLAWRRHPWARPAAAVFVGLTIYYPAVTAVFIVVGRYRWPLEDVLSLLAGLGVTTLLSVAPRLGRRAAGGGTS